jgi:hypothetical protein
MAITTYKLPSGAEIEVQSTLAPPARQGVDQASALDKMTAGAWNEAMERVAELADQAIAKLEADEELQGSGGRVRGQHRRENRRYPGGGYG